MAVSLPHECMAKTKPWSGLSRRYVGVCAANDWRRYRRPRTGCSSTLPFKVVAVDVRHALLEADALIQAVGSLA